MRILVISPRPPYSLTDGAWLCAYNIFKQLAAYHEIYLLSFYKKSDGGRLGAELRDIFRETHMVELESNRRHICRYIKNVLSWGSGWYMREQNPVIYSRFKEKMTELVYSKNIDVVHCLLLGMAEFAFNIEDCVRVLHVIDSETLRMKRLISSRSAWNHFRNVGQLIHYYRLKTFEGNAIKKFDAVITVGKKDLQVLSGLAPHANIALIPNGVDTEYYHPLPREISECPVVVFFGKMTTPPNRDAVLYFYRDIFTYVRKTLPTVRFYVVGESPPEEVRQLSKDENIIVTGYVDDIRKYVSMADVVVCPMRKGGGIKNKILEAMSMGRAVVSTSIGAEGVDVTHGRNIMIADNPEEFAEHVLKLLSDEKLRDKIVVNAGKLVNEKYTWGISCRKYERLCEDLIGSRKDGIEGPHDNKKPETYD